MPEFTLADVITRLDRLESALYQLIEVVRSGQGRGMQVTAAPMRSPVQASAPALETTGTVAPGEPPIIQVAPPSRGAVQAGQASAASEVPTGSEEAGVEPVRPYDPYGFRTDLEVPGAGSTIQQVLRRVFEAGLASEPEDTWALMTKLTHPSQLEGPRALDHYKAFNWHKLRRTASTYLKNGDPSTFVIAYTEPAEVTPEVERVRVFIRAGDNRMPVPIGFLRDASQGNAWRVTLMSL